MTTVKTINSIEVASICNNSCPYCPAPLQHKHRETGLMEMTVFECALDWVARFVELGSQKELNLFGVGEPTLHPDLVVMTRTAREALGPDRTLHLNTNGKLMTDGLALELKHAGIDSIDITGHDHRITARTVQLFERLRIPYRVSHDFAVRPNNWAGQVDWFTPQYRYPCHWLRDGQVMVMSNGDVTACCLDAFGRGVFSNVFDEDLDRREARPFETCKTCHHIVPEGMAWPQAGDEQGEVAEHGPDRV